MRIFLAACAVAILCLAPADGQQPENQQPTFRGGINFVRIDVVVTGDRARPVTDLRQADFEIFEDGRPQTIEQFKLVRVDGNTPDGAPPRQIRSLQTEELELAREDSRLFVIFLDEYHVTQINGIRIRDTLIRFVRTQLGANDLVAIMYPLTPVSALTFTRDHDSIAGAIRRFEGRSGNFTPRNPIEENWWRSGVRNITSQVVRDALEALAIRLGGLRDQRKSVLYVSEGLMFSPMLAHYELREAFTAANRNNVAFYALDPRGLTSTRMTARREILQMISEETDGRAIVNVNTYDEQLANMVRDSSVYYLLGYTSSLSVNDGKFHDVKVRVKRDGVQVRARKGYWALTEADVARATAPPTPGVAAPIQRALGSIAASVHAAQYARTWFGTSRGADGKTRVTVVWEALSAPGRSGLPQAAAVSLAAVDGTGQVVFEGRAPQTTGSPAATHALSFDTAPGALELRLTTEAASGGTLDTEVRRIRVPDLTGVSLSTPRVFRARTARERQATTADDNAVPVATREFSRTDRLLIRFDAYREGAGAEPTAALLNRAGSRMADLRVTPAAAGGTHQVDVGLGAIAAGEYLVEITLPDEDGDISELVAFRLGA